MIPLPLSCKAKGLQLAATQDVHVSVMMAPVHPLSIPSLLLPCMLDSRVPPASQKPSRTPQRPKNLTGRNTGIWLCSFPLTLALRTPKRGLSPPEHSMFSSPRALHSRLDILKKELATHFISSIISKVTY